MSLRLQAGVQLSGQVAAPIETETRISSTPCTAPDMPSATRRAIASIPFESVAGIRTPNSSPPLDDSYSRELKIQFVHALVEIRVCSNSSWNHDSYS